MIGEVAHAASFDDVRRAAQRLRGTAHRTPVIASRTLDERTGGRVYLKAENFQRMGAFKFRGAYNRLAQLTPDQRAGGVVAFSSGNHAQGVALAAKLLEVPAAIVMPSDAPAAKLAATRGYGAEVVFYDRERMNRAELAASIANERGATLVPPYDDPAIIAGQGTVVLELIEDAGPLDVLFVCLGGGGLLAGSCLAACALSPGVRIYGVEPEAGDDWVRSWQGGRIVSIPVPKTIADGQQTQAPGELTWPIVRRLAEGIVTVSDDEIRDAMRFAFERLKLVVEPSGASALAALLAGRVDVRGARVGVTISGGNVDPATFAECIATR
ncbi:serine/threonine dehydratase [Vulcanimicrobium alpinum]|uniref:threonine ammonia-lyase n=1 Tax=Vulcanimicrobium alpinum TaxID=3016050 RepID=A0AAN1XVM3_UNVUL|nr:threo-3-hydroxy-L-aspartate ammonia-lyase [Vulcanimicrobium alpinum]BDE05122.1 serine/threonine dehydratase [Vulcanimicrobium alpinum]